jgi:hypothetical protein
MEATASHFTECNILEEIVLLLIVYVRHYLYCLLYKKKIKKDVGVLWVQIIFMLF